MPDISLKKKLITQSRVIAKGKRIRDIQRLVDQYGGQQSKWLKKSSPVFESGGSYSTRRLSKRRYFGKPSIKHLPALHKP